MLTNLLALIGLAAVPALLAVYLLRNRVKRLSVSSLMLWTERTRIVQGGGRLQRNRLPLLFFLELLILLLLVLAAAAPRILSSRGTIPLTVILDDSASMSAVGPDGKSAAERVLQQLPGLLRKGRFGPVRFMLAGTEPRWLGPEAEQQLRQGRLPQDWTTRAASCDLDQALLLARSESAPGKKILFLGDTRPSTEPTGGELRWISAGLPLSNAGFIHAARSGARCLVELQGNGPVELSLDLGGQTRTETIQLEPGIPQRRIYALADPDARFEAWLPDDPLSMDNHVILLPKPPRRVGTRLSIADPDLHELMARTVAASGLDDSGTADCDLLITDAVGTDAAENASTWFLHLHRITDGTPFTGPFVMDRRSPLLDGISFEGLVWSAADNAPLPGMPVVAAGNIPLLTRTEDLAGRPHFHLQIDPSLSTLPDSPAWPSLVWNLMEMRAAEKPGFREVNLRSGMIPEFVGSAEWSGILQPGLIEMVENGQTYEAAFNFLDAGESDLRVCGSGDDGDWNDPETLERHYVDLAPLIILVGLALLALHQWLVRREDAAIAGRAHGI